MNLIDLDLTAQANRDVCQRNPFGSHSLYKSNGYRQFMAEVGDVAHQR